MSTSAEYASYSPSSSSSLTIIASPAPSYVSPHLPSKLKSFFKFGGGRKFNARDQLDHDPAQSPSDNRKS
ncbi:hypothetical protein BGZ70_005018, partial [Mortierella alpina]